jgi:PAS domain S-box-containing protein
MVPRETTPVIPAAEEILTLHDYEESFFSKLLDCSPNPVLVINPDASIRYVNSAFEKETGFKSAELMGVKPPYPWWTDNMEDRFYKQLDLHTKTPNYDGVKSAKRLFQKKNGQRFWVEISTSKVTEDDSVQYLMTTWVDVTRRVEEEETARTLVNASSDSAVLIDLDHRILAINKIGARRLSRTVEDLLNEDYYEAIPPELVPSTVTNIKKVLSTHKRVNYEAECAGLVFGTSICPIFNTQQNIFRLALFARDITERKQTEKKVRNAFRELMSAVRASVPATEHLSASVLTPREECVVQFLAEGKNTKEISMALGLSVKTIETHRIRVMNKLGMNSVAELTKFAIRQGITGL